MRIPSTSKIPKSSCNQTVHTLPLMLTVLLGACLLSACTLPLTDSVALGAENTQRALVGYDKASYHYPIQVPGTNRYVEIISPEPLGFSPTYDDYKDWKAGRPFGTGTTPPDAAPAAP